MFHPDSYDRFKKFASHPCRCACGCKRKIHDDHDEQCNYCKSGQCKKHEKCDGTGYIWNNETQESKPCSCVDGKMNRLSRYVEE
jgi:hypothetical protein